MQLQHNEIENFDIIEKGDIIWARTISPREVADDKQLLRYYELTNKNEITAIHKDYDLEETPKKINFFSLGRQFKLILNKPRHLVTQDFNIKTLDSEGKETVVPYNRDDVQVLDGFVDGEEHSKAMASYNKQDKLMIAQIKTGKDTIIVEPTYLHKDNLFNITNDSSTDLNSKIFDDTMIVYNLRDHKQFNYEHLKDRKTLFNPQALCAGVSLSDYSNDTSNEGNELEDKLKISMENSTRKKLSRRGIEYLTDKANDKTRCTLHLVADYLFYRNVGKGDLQTTINYLLALVNRVNHIYLLTKWEVAEDNVEPFSNIGFTVQNITIHQEYTRISSGDFHYNMQSNRTWGAREFLDNFSKYAPARHYCLNIEILCN